MKIIYDTKKKKYIQGIISKNASGGLPGKSEMIYGTKDSALVVSEELDLRLIEENAEFDKNRLEFQKRER